MRHGLTPDAAVELSGTLTRIASVLERLDARLAAGSPAAAGPGSMKSVAGPGSLDSVAGPAPSGSDGVAVPVESVAGALPAPRAADSPGKLLERGLHEVLAEISRVKRDTEVQIAHLGGRQMTDEQKQLEQTAFLALAALRRRQADLIYRMQSGPVAGGGGIDPLAAL